MGLDEKKDKGNIDVDRMNYCMLSLYDFAEVLIILVITKKITPAGLAAAVSATRGTQMGFESLTFLAASLPQVSRSCERITGAKNQIGGKKAEERSRLELPSGFDFDLLKLQSLPLEIIPSCPKLGMARIFEKKNDQVSCSMSLIFLTLPATFGKVKTR